MYRLLAVSLSLDKCVIVLLCLPPSPFLLSPTLYSFVTFQGLTIVVYQGYMNVNVMEPHLPALMDVAGVPFTGSGIDALVLCRDKAIVAAVAARHGVATPREVGTPCTNDITAAWLTFLFASSFLSGPACAPTHTTK